MELATRRNSGERKGKEALMMLSLPTEAGSNSSQFSLLFGNGQSLFSLKVLSAATDLKKSKVSWERGGLCRNNCGLEVFLLEMGRGRTGA